MRSFAPLAGLLALALLGMAAADSQRFRGGASEDATAPKADPKTVAGVVAAGSTLNSVVSDARDDFKRRLQRADAADAADAARDPTPLAAKEGPVGGPFLVASSGNRKLQGAEAATTSQGFRGSASEDAAVVREAPAVRDGTAFQGNYRDDWGRRKLQGAEAAKAVKATNAARDPAAAAEGPVGGPFLVTGNRKLQGAMNMLARCSCGGKVFYGTGSCFCSCKASDVWLGRPGDEAWQGAGKRRLAGADAATGAKAAAGCNCGGKAYYGDTCWCEEDC